MIFKIQITFLFILLFTAVHGTDMFEAIMNDLKTPKRSDTCIIVCQRSIYCSIFCINNNGVNDNTDADELQNRLIANNNPNGLYFQNVVNNENVLNNQRNVRVNHHLAAAEQLCKEYEDDNIPANRPEHGRNSECIYCYYLYKNDRLAYNVHGTGQNVDPHPHRIACTHCLSGNPEIFAQRDCQICRQPIYEVMTCQAITEAMVKDERARQDNQNRAPILIPIIINNPPVLVAQAPRAPPRIPIRYIGELLPMLIASIWMFGLAYTMAKLNKRSQNLLTHGEYGTSFDFDWVMCNRDTWGSLMFMTLGYLYKKRKNATILFSIRGWMYLLVPMIAHVAFDNMDPLKAQYATILPLIPIMLDFFQGMISRVSYIIPKDLLLYAINEPQLSRYGQAAKTTPIQRLKNFFKYNAYYVNFAGSLAPLIRLKPVMEVYGEFDHGVSDTTVMAGTVFLILTAFGFIVQSHVAAFKQKLTDSGLKRDNILVFSQFAQFCFIMFFMVHSNPYIFITIMIGNILYTLLFILNCIRKYCSNECTREWDLHPANNNSIQLANNNNV